MSDVKNAGQLSDRRFGLDGDSTERSELDAHANHIIPVAKI